MMFKVQGPAGDEKVSDFILKTAESLGKLKLSKALAEFPISSPPEKTTPIRPSMEVTREIGVEGWGQREINIVSWALQKERA